MRWIVIVLLLSACSGGDGARGDVGAMGTPGERGAPGDRGAQGLPGVTGAIGTMGAQGEPGMQGVQGEPGTQGPKGDTGDTGAKGDKGDQGNAGPAGPAPSRVIGTFMAPVTQASLALSYNGDFTEAGLYDFTTASGTFRVQLRVHLITVGSGPGVSYTIAPVVDSIRQDPCGMNDVPGVPLNSGTILPVVCDAIVTMTPGLHTVGFHITYATSGTSFRWFVKGSAFVSAPTALILIEDLT